MGYRWNDGPSTAAAYVSEPYPFPFEHEFYPGYEMFNGGPAGGSSAPRALTAQERAWVLTLDRSALERLPDAARRRRYLEEINWRDIEFPGNVPKGGRDRKVLLSHWKLSEELFSAVAAVTPERRVPSTIGYHDPMVVKVPGQPSHWLFPEARDAFVRMRQAAKADGVRLEIASSWRSAAKQAAISKSQRNPKAAARGKSAHMYGLAVDLRLRVPGLDISDANTRTAEKMANVVRMYRSPVYKWMALRAQHYGWYPYRREPWHWEYNPPGFKERFEQSTPSGSSGAELVQFEQRAANGQPWGYRSRVAGTRVAVFVPPAALGHDRIDLMLYIHGLLGPCGKLSVPDGFITGPQFALGTAVRDSGLPMVLLVPLLQEGNDRSWRAAGLDKPARLNAFLAEATGEIGRRLNRATSVSRLVVSGHSRAFGVLYPLARSHADPAHQDGALARLSALWLLDATYGTVPMQAFAQLLSAHPGLAVRIIYRAGSFTDKFGGRKRSGPIELRPIRSTIQHCDVPRRVLGTLLSDLSAQGPGVAASEQEAEDELWQWLSNPAASTAWMGAPAPSGHSVRGVGAAGRAAPKPVAGSGHLPLLGANQTPPADPRAYRRFRLTTYQVVNQDDLPTGAVRVPLYDDKGRRIAEGSPAFFGQLALEGTARLSDGRLVNVTGTTVSVSHDEYAPVLAYHQKAYAAADRKNRALGRPLTPTQYSGIVVQGGRVVRAFTFRAVDATQRGARYGMSHGLPYTPFRTLAADIGYPKYKKVDPRWKGRGGLVPVGTHVYIKEFDGLPLPDGTTHDGWFIVNDTGGAIFGAHFDVFTGTTALRKALKRKLPEFGCVWFAGIEQRIPAGYTYGLSK
jgi:D-alanyl-D-alanine carboxypeptidase/3D domain